MVNAEPYSITVLYDGLFMELLGVVALKTNSMYVLAREAVVQDGGGGEGKGKNNTKYLEG